jgi:hypothetical protein
MPADPAEPARPGSSRDGAEQRRCARKAHVQEAVRYDERYGPLRVLRTHKDDGRSLTMYGCDPRDGALAPHGAAAEPRA